ncbi:MAG: CCA tRNA nucleotidyltransferase, partial [Nitrospirae bacterium]
MKNIKNIIMSNRINAKVFSSGREVYIVGGYLRDVLLGEKAKDIDYIVRGDIKEFALELLMQESGLPGKTKAQNLLDNATIVELKKEQMIRIVLRNEMTLDFTGLKGKLEDNLRERDFTMNALAWSPKTGVIDPLNGLNDIKKKTIKAISAENFMNDPLRLLRVYRFVSELGWDADPETRNMAKALKEEIKRSAPERITQEVFKLLNSKNYQQALKMALRDGLLEQLLSMFDKKLSENIKSLSRLETTLKKLPTKFKPALEKPFSQELTLKGLLRLEQALAGSILSKNRLRLSRHILERLKVIHELLKTIHYPVFSASKIFDIFFKAKEAAFDFLILSGNIRLLSQLERF